MGNEYTIFEGFKPDGSAARMAISLDEQQNQFSEGQDGFDPADYFTTDVKDITEVGTIEIDGDTVYLDDYFSVVSH